MSFKDHIFATYVLRTVFLLYQVQLEMSGLQTRYKRGRGDNVASAYVLFPL
jgi:hypothetical protein